MTEAISTLIEREMRRSQKGGRREEEEGKANEEYNQ